MYQTRCKVLVRHSPKTSIGEASNKHNCACDKTHELANTLKTRCLTSNECNQPRPSKARKQTHDQCRPTHPPCDGLRTTPAAKPVGPSVAPGRTLRPCVLFAGLGRRRARLTCGLRRARAPTRVPDPWSLIPTTGPPIAPCALHLRPGGLPGGGGVSCRRVCVGRPSALRLQNRLANAQRLRRGAHNKVVKGHAGGLRSSCWLLLHSSSHKVSRKLHAACYSIQAIAVH